MGLGAAETTMHQGSKVMQPANPGAACVGWWWRRASSPFVPVRVGLLNKRLHFQAPPPHQSPLLPAATLCFLRARRVNLWTFPVYRKSFIDSEWELRLVISCVLKSLTAPWRMTERVFVFFLNSGVSVCACKRALPMRGCVF